MGCKNIDVRVLIWILSALIFYTETAAQKQLQFSFQQYSTADGLNSNQVNSIVQDLEGYLWIGSTDGLQRFDGIRFLTFRYQPGNTQSLPSNAVSMLKIDHKGRLWVLVADGKLGIFDTKSFVFKDVTLRKVEDNSKFRQAKTVVIDEFGGIFLLLESNELYVWEEKSSTFIPAFESLLTGKKLRIASFVHEHGTNKYWFGLDGAGLAVYNTLTGKWSDQNDNNEQEPIIEHFKEIKAPYNLHFDQKGRLWFMDWPAFTANLYCWDNSTKKPLLEKVEFSSVHKTYVEISPLLEEKDGTIWAYGIKLLARFDEDEVSFDQVQSIALGDQINTRNIRCLFEDREHNIWVATSSNGLYRFNPREQYFTNIGHLNHVTGLPGDGSPIAFQQLRNGEILVSAWGDGVQRYDASWTPLPLGLSGFDQDQGPIWDMITTEDGAILWLVGQPGIIWRLDQHSQQMRLYSPAILQNRTVRQIVEDHQGNLWLGMQGLGLFRWDAKNGKQRFEEGLQKYLDVPNCVINHLSIDLKGQLWVATGKYGAFVINPANNKVIRHFSINNSDETKLPEEGVSCALPYDDSLVILSTSSYLLRYNSKQGTSYQLASLETLSGYISALQKDRQGYIWVSTTNGLYRANVAKKAFIRFDRRDGIANEEFSLAASYQMKSGSLIFGAADRFTVFQPEALVLDEDSLKVTITGFHLMNKTLSVDSLLQLDKIRLKTKQSSLVIDFSTLTYKSRYKVHYKMLGLDDDWQSNELYSAVYSYLPPGDYKFLLKSADSEANTSKITSLNILITPPLWKSWWFYSMLALVFAGIAFRLDSQRMKRKELMQKMRTDIATNLHREIDTALNNINILSEMAALKANRDTKKAQEYIMQINVKSQSMIAALDDMLWAIRPENDGLAKVVERLEEFIHLLKSRPGISINFTYDPKIIHQRLDMRLRQMILRLLKGAISNIIRIGGNHFNINLTVEKATLHYSLEFNTEACDLQQLHNLLQREELATALSKTNARMEVETRLKVFHLNLHVPLL